MQPNQIVSHQTFNTNASASLAGSLDISAVPATAAYELQIVIDSLATGGARVAIVDTIDNFAHYEPLALVVDQGPINEPEESASSWKSADIPGARFGITSPKLAMCAYLPDTTLTV